MCEAQLAVPDAPRLDTVEVATRWFPVSARLVAFEEGIARQHAIHKVRMLGQLPARQYYALWSDQFPGRKSSITSGIGAAERGHEENPECIHRHCERSRGAD